MQKTCNIYHLTCILECPYSNRHSEVLVTACLKLISSILIKPFRTIFRSVVPLHRSTECEKDLLLIIFKSDFLMF